ncbi:ubiquitin carboxyl-terminal hydrolase 13 isoform X1 [Tachysurus ichikawai]
MATDLGELLVPYMPTIRVPRSGDRVFKSECAFSFDSPESEGGLYVCMNTFLGFGREHVERHYRKTGQSVYMHLKRNVKQKATGAAGGAVPRRRNGKIFLGLIYCWGGLVYSGLMSLLLLLSRQLLCPINPRG